MASRTASEDPVSIEKQQKTSPGARDQVAEASSGINIKNPTAMPPPSGEKEQTHHAAGPQQEDGKTAPAERMSAFQTAILTLALCVKHPPPLGLAEFNLQFHPDVRLSRRPRRYHHNHGPSHNIRTLQQHRRLHLGWSSIHTRRSSINSYLG